MSVNLHPDVWLNILTGEKMNNFKNFCYGAFLLLFTAVSLSSLVSCDSSSSIAESAPRHQLEPLDPTPRLVIMPAFDAEMDMLLDEAQIQYIL